MIKLRIIRVPFSGTEQKYYLYINYKINYIHKLNEKRQTGKDEHISAIAIPTNQVKKQTTIHPQTRLAGPAYRRLEPYRGVIPVKSVIVENAIARVLNIVCTINRKN